MSVLVLGSANLDLVYEVERIPRPGETLLAKGFSQHPGGKGNNQATAAARAGAAVSFIAAMGHDEAADTLTASLRQSKVETLVRGASDPTGTALITVDGSAENTIVVNSGANGQLTNLTDNEAAAVAGADILLLQLEIPLDTVIAGARAAHRGNTGVVLNAAPFRPLPMALLDEVDLLVVNEHEARLLNQDDDDQTDDQAGSSAITVEQAGRLAGDLLRLVPAVVITLGQQGAIVQARDIDAVHVPGKDVTAVDTTGAGDTFCGALAAALDTAPAGWSGAGIVSAAEFATAAAALSVQQSGAVPSIPTREEIDHFSSSH